jgi:ADP-glucose pyrophosphorylase
MYSPFVVRQTEADKKLLADKGGIPIGIGKNSHIRRAIIDKNARIGDNVKVFHYLYNLWLRACLIQRI